MQVIYIIKFGKNNQQICLTTKECYIYNSFVHLSMGKLDYKILAKIKIK